jgi:tetratricopeptide (TPR) repeat protein
MQKKKGAPQLAKNGPGSSSSPSPLKYDKQQQAQIIKQFDQRAAEEDLRLARQCWQRGDAEGCRTALRRLLQRKPDHRDGVLLLAEVQLLDQRPAEAVEPLARLCQKHPTDPEIRHVMALVLDAAGEPQKALVCYRQAVDLAPDELVFQASLELAEYEMRRRQRGTATLASATEPADEASPAKTPVPGAAADVAAAPATPRADDEAPDSANDLALADQAAPQQEPSPSAAQGAQPSAEQQSARPPRLARDQREAAAAPAEAAPQPPSLSPGLEEPATEGPNSGQPAMRLKLGATGGASLNVVRVAGHEPPSQSDKSGQSVQAVKPSRAAAPSVEDAPRLASPSPRPALAAAPAPSPQAAVTARDLLQRADDALRQGHGDQAATLLHQAAKIEPDDDRIVMAGAVLALRYDQPDLAAVLLEQGVRRFSGSARLFRTLGTARYRQGRFDQAETALQRALALDNTSALAYFLMASTLEKLGRKAEAQEHFRQAYALDPSLAQRR